MTQYLPKDGFTWYDSDWSVDLILKILNGLNEISDIGLALEVDISYPTSLHDDHNDLLYLPESNIPPGSTIKKLTVNLYSKTNYVVHYIALKQALKAGLVLEKVHNIIIIMKISIAFN